MILNGGDHNNAFCAKQMLWPSPQKPGRKAADIAKR
jgi:hypothetical protein